MFRFIGKLMKYGFIGAMGIAVLGLVIGMLVGGDDEPQQQKTPVTQPAQAKDAQSPYSLAELREREKVLQREVDKAWEAFENNTDPSKQEQLYEKASEASRRFSELSKYIVKAKNQPGAGIPQAIKKQFSIYDGSHRALVKMVKNDMHDPKSFDHDNTRLRVLPNNAGVQVTMTYRGKNGLGNLVKEQVTAQFDMNGKFIKVVE